MAQGKFKSPKIQVPGKKDKGQRKKQPFIKKGAMSIAPKKQKLMAAAKLKKGLEKGIRACIEDELTAKTVALEPRSLSMLKPSTSKGKSNTKGKSKKS